MSVNQTQLVIDYNTLVTIRCLKTTLIGGSTVPPTIQNAVFNKIHSSQCRGLRDLFGEHMVQTHHQHPVPSRLCEEERVCVVGLNTQSHWTEERQTGGGSKAEETPEKGKDASRPLSHFPCVSPLPLPFQIYTDSINYVHDGQALNWVGKDPRGVELRISASCAM